MYLGKKPNCLLTKDDVGRSKPTTRKLPQDGWVYGKAEKKDDEGVSEITRSWKSHSTSREGAPDRDFKKLNKLSLRAGVTNARAMGGFRRTTDARVRIPKGSKDRMIRTSNEFYFGMPSKPSTPIHDIIGNTYGERAEFDIVEGYAYDLAQRKRGKSQIGLRHTRASDLAATAITGKDKSEEVSRNQFKLSKFQKCGPRINTNLKKTSDAAKRTETQ